MIFKIIFGINDGGHDTDGGTDQHFNPGKLKVQEARFRRMAKRQGLTLLKSCRRDPRVLDYQGYMLCRGDTSRMETNDAIDDRQFLATG